MPDEPRPWILRPIGVPGIDPVLAVPPEGATLGRDPECTIALAKHQFPQVSSSQHARITLVDGALEVTDLASKNGTYVNGVKTTQRRLASGDVVQLGEHGPRFAAVREAGLDETMDVAPARHGGTLGGMGESTITNLRTVLGAADQQDVDDAVDRSSRRTIAIAAALSVVVLGAAVFGFISLRESGRREADALRELNTQLRNEVADARTDVADQRQAFDEQRTAVIRERDALANRIKTIEEQGDDGQLEERIQDELSTLRGRLDSANERLELFDPVNLEKERLRDVSEVHAAVVLIEATTRFRDTATRRRLHVAKLDDGREVANLEFEGNLVEQESTGSGFCVSADGHIITNAHVVMPVDRRDRVDGPGGLKFDVETELNVVFTDTDVRYRATLVEVTRDAEEDLALIKIEPFDGMPVVSAFETDKPRPAPGTEVYLFGFPLGKLVLQDGDRVVASTFKGILSREVGEYLQIDASVHPGNSGGPVTDAKGRVLGVVSRVQNTPGGQLANAIGYVIPISHVDLIWPPGGKNRSE